MRGGTATAVAMAAAMTATMLTGCREKPVLAVDGAWIRLPAVEGRPGAAYFTVHGGPEPEVLVKISTPIAVRAELHESMAAAGGAMTMAPIADLPLAPGDTIDFAPGGKHVMLFDVNPKLHPGDTAPLTISFADGTTASAVAQIVPAGAPKP